ncbi:citrate synthase/methylcitrate synthase [Haloarcula sp. S1CR25-12]|uniref:Citrate synthase n=1 Tax=Haloarcula saliterrae TaxID=2950534 RepID=A0ABU2FB41_9EURY|nr:citrate/2-methylcitrate synthase [Haloarcula sp. S1CR25-12]MDS0259485.1 citrate synthase/methylcitrate synthase [Haloarcula sp. S1CR25-12]
MTPSVFDPGLESITVAETELSDVDGEAGELVVRGYPIAELAANATYEEAASLLLSGRLPPADELRAFRSSLADARRLPDPVTALLRAAADDADPMDALRMGLGATSLGVDEETPSAVARRVVAVTPTVVATYWRAREGLDPVTPDPDLGHAANYRYMLTGDEPTTAERRALETLLTTMVDHGLNPSTFTARTVVSTESDLVSAATAAVGTLKGPRHGGNLRRVFDLLRTAHEADDVATVVEEHVDRSGWLPGFGHRVYDVRDPRAAVLSAALETLPGSTSDAFRATVRELEAAGTAALSDRQSRHTAPTVEFYAVALLYSAGVPPALFTPTFAVARVGGWMAHCLEQRSDNELVRPVSRYVGATGRSWTPVEERSVDSAQSRRDAVDPIADRLSTLAEPARLEILLALDEAETPVEYSTLRAATSIDDKGRFNYHLRQLRGTFVANRDGGYALGQSGRRFVDAVVDGDFLPDD